MLLNQVMSPLPTDRVQITRPFNISGDEYCGPFFEHYKIRGKNPTRYILQFFAASPLRRYIYLFIYSPTVGTLTGYLTISKLSSKGRIN